MESKLTPKVREALDKIGRSIPRIGIKPADEKKIKALRKKRARRGDPHRNLDMVPENATPEEAHRIEMNERAKRREERSQRSLLTQRHVETDTPRRTSTDTEKVKAAHEKRERRRMRRFKEAANEGWKS